MKAPAVIYLLVLAASVSCDYWYYNYENHETHDESFYTCYRQQSGSNTISIFLQQNSDGVSDQSLRNIGNAKSAGLAVTAALLPCRNIPAETYLQNLNKAFPFKVIDKYWLELPVGAGVCGWDNLELSRFWHGVVRWRFH